MTEETVTFQISNELRSLLNEHPEILNNEFREIKEAITLYHLKAIFDAMVEKAKSGDTPAARFIVEFATPEPIVERLSTDIGKWEEVAIELRNKLGLNMSAEDLVIKLLKWASTQGTFVKEVLDQDAT